MHRVPTRADLLDRCAAIRFAMREDARLLAACVEARQGTRGVAAMGDFWRHDLRAAQRALLKFRKHARWRASQRARIPKIEPPMPRSSP
jgi:hypothetical protein